MYDAPAATTEADLRALEADYCSWGDTVHYLDHPKFFETCEGSYMYDTEGRAFLDLQMWYSAVNFGYRNPRLNAAAHAQLTACRRWPRSICIARRSSWRR